MSDPELPPTEGRNPRSFGLDSFGTLEILEALNDADASVAGAVREALPALGRLVDAGVEALDKGGRVVYFGAGTSGRLAVVDAAELIPTFALESGRIVARIAGGPRAVTSVAEGAEDSASDGESAADDLTTHDLAIGIAASGSTPFVGGALAAAREVGSATALVTSNPDSRLAELADIVVVTDTGPEVLTGSTRLKAGTAAKLVLNSFSTAVMIRRGRVYDNLMVTLVATNDKLRHRSTRTLITLTGLEADEASQVLEAAQGDLKTALVSQLAGVSADVAREQLLRNDQHVRRAIESAATLNGFPSDNPAEDKPVLTTTPLGKDVR